MRAYVGCRFPSRVHYGSDQRWFAPPLQVNSSSLVPLPREAGSSRHLPKTRSWPLDANTQRCAAVPLHRKRSILFLLAVPLWKSSTHLPAKPLIGPPGGGGGGVCEASSYAPTSQAGPCGRDTPRWSVLPEQPGTVGRSEERRVG